MNQCVGCHASCVTKLSRRRFLVGCSAGLAGAELTGLDFGRTALPAHQATASKPRVDVIYVRPPVPEVISWPGGNCDVDAQQALFTKTLTDAARKLAVDLRVRPKPLNTTEEVNAYLESMKQSPPDGLLVGAMELHRWPQVKQIVEQRGDIPTVVYSHLSAFTQQLQIGRTTPKTFVGATQDVGWLEQALRMLAAIWRIKHTRLLLVSDRELKEPVTPIWGTVFHRVPKSRFIEEFGKTKVTAEVKAMADQYAKAAARVVEPSPEDLVEAAKNYFAIRRLLEAERCDGVCIDCLGWKNPVCVAFSRLMDEGLVAACEQDRPAAVAQLITLLVFDRPGFIQDPSPNTVNNTLIGAHCTSPTKLKGTHDSYRAPFLLRNYHTQTGVSPQVLWPEGDPVTIIDFDGWDKLVVGSGRVVSNIQQPPSGCCRTAVEITVEGAVDTRDTIGFHQLFVWGNLVRPLRAFGQLAGVEVRAIC